jgi:hypothetical protein
MNIARLKRVKKIQLQQLIGKLNWAARAVRGGRTFLRRLIDLSNSVKRKHHYIDMNAMAKADLDWWCQFMEVFNGTTCFIKGEIVPYSEFATDACEIGGGSVYGSDWLYVNWACDAPEFGSEHINVKELAMVGEAAKRWAPEWAGRHIVVYTDSMVTMYAINKGTSRNPTAMCVLRKLFWLSAMHGFHITARHIPGIDNVASDSISRLHESKNRMWLDNFTNETNGHISNDALSFLQECWCPTSSYWTRNPEPIHSRPTL